MSECVSTVYNVKMSTPIGVRLGCMTVWRRYDKISGYLDILKHKESFEGTIDSNGNCKIIGKIITLMRTIDYEAIGKILPDSLSLLIKDDRHILEITGDAQTKERNKSIKTL